MVWAVVNYTCVALLIELKIRTIKLKAAGGSKLPIRPAPLL